jgi:polyribonucleotide nucleotidyltransferase
MAQRVPAELLVLAPKQTPQDGADPIDQAGHAVVAMLHQAAHLSEENLQRAMSMAHKLSVQLRTAEDRIAQLQGEVEYLQNRANRAEQWLETIKQEIEDNLIASIEANRREPLAVH